MPDRPRRGAILLVLVCYALLVGVLLGPVLRHPADVTFPVISRDDRVNFWHLWWMKYALETGRSPWRADVVFHPDGADLTVTEFIPAYSLLALPWLVLSDSARTTVLVNNLLVAATFLLAAIAGFLFSLRESRRVLGSAVAGAAIGFCAFRFHHLEHLNLLSTFWVPLLAHAVGIFCLAPPPGGNGREVVSGGGPRWPIWLPIFVLGGFGAAGTSVTMLADALTLLVPWVLLVAWIRPERRRPRFGVRLAIALAGLLVGTLPVSWGWLAAAMAGRLPETSTMQARAWSADLLSFVVPGQSALLRPLFGGLAATLHGAGGRNMFLGYGFLALAVAGVLRLRRDALPLLVPFGLGILLSLGPGLWVAGRLVELGFSPYTLLVKAVPILAVGRVPERFVVVALTALGPLAAAAVGVPGCPPTARNRDDPDPLPAGTEAAGGPLHRMKRLAGPALVVLALAWLAVELYPGPLRPDPVSMHPVYSRLKDEPVPGSVLELTAYRAYGNDFLFHQIAHRRPLVNGPVNWRRATRAGQASGTDLVSRLQDIRQAAGAATELHGAGVAFVVCHRIWLTNETWHASTAFYDGLMDPWYRDEQLAVYRPRSP